MVSLSVNDLFSDAVTYDSPKIAYMCYSLILKGLGESFFDDCENLINVEEVELFMQQDPLKIKLPRLYITKHNDEWCCYFANNEQEVRGLHLQLFKVVPGEIIDNTNSIDTSFWFENKLENKSLFDLRKEITSFPYFIFKI